MERVYENGKLIAKECSKCHQIKLIDNFYTSINSKDNHVNKCRDCYKKSNSEYYRNTSETRKEYQKKYYEQHKEARAKAYRKKKKQKHKENIERIIKEICHKI